SGIAREELGSADRWPEIRDASSSIVEPGGARLTDPDVIYPGWTVRLPAHGEPAARMQQPHGAAGTGGSGHDLEGGPLDPSWSAPAERSSRAPSTTTPSTTTPS